MNSPSQQKAAPLEWHREVLDNGMAVVVVPKRDVPVVTTMLTYHVGSVDEREGETGLAHFLEHMMFKGTERYAVGQIDHLTQLAGGSNNALTSYDYTGYHLDLPVETWETALDIEAGRMNGCIFDPEEIEHERTVVLSELDGGQDSPSHALYEEVTTLAYKVHPYHHPIIGWRSEVEVVTRERMFDFYKRFYHPANATLVICGDVDPHAAVRITAEKFRDLPARPRTPRTYTAEPAQDGERRVVLRPSENRVDRLALAWHTCQVGEPEDWALDVLSTILTAGRSSRLYRKLVEELQLAGSIQTSNDVRLFPGLFCLSASAIAEVDLATLEAAILEEIERARSEPPTAAEMERAIGLLEANHLFSLQTTGDIASSIGMFTAFGREDIFFSYLENLSKVTGADVQRAAERYLSRKGMTVGWSLASPHESQDLDEGEDESEGNDS